MDLDLATKRVTTTLPHPEPVTSVLYLGHSDTLATSDADGVARIWHLPGPLMTGEPGSFFTADLSRGHVLAVASNQNTARLWNVADPRQPVPLGPVLTDAARSKNGSGAAALSPDGDTLVVGADDGTSQVWDVRSPADPVPLMQLGGPKGLIESITFSANGRLLAIASNDHTVGLWNMADPRNPEKLATLTGPTNYVYSAAFSRNGRMLAAASVDERFYLWDISAPRAPNSALAHPLIEAGTYVNAVAFSPDGRTLAAGIANGDVQLLNVADPRRPMLLGAPLTGPTSYVNSVFFSPSGRTLAATAGGDGLVWLWNMSCVRQPPAGHAHRPDRRHVHQLLRRRREHPGLGWCQQYGSASGTSTSSRSRPMYARRRGTSSPGASGVSTSLACLITRPARRIRGMYGLVRTSRKPFSLSRGSLVF